MIATLFETFSENFENVDLLLAEYVKIFKKMIRLLKLMFK